MGEAKTLNIGKNATALILDKLQTDGIVAVSAYSAFEMKQVDLERGNDYGILYTS